MLAGGSVGCARSEVACVSLHGEPFVVSQPLNTQSAIMLGKVTLARSAGCSKTWLALEGQALMMHALSHMHYCLCPSCSGVFPACWLSYALHCCFVRMPVDSPP